MIHLHRQMRVSGTVKQVTDAPGLVSLSLAWPRRSNVTLTANIMHQRAFEVIRPSIVIQVEGNTYEIWGEVGFHIY